MNKGNRRGYTLIEALVSVAIISIGVTSALSGMRAMARAEYRTTQTELASRLATEKYEEVLATGEVAQAPLDGNFQDRNQPGFTYRVETEPSPVQNLTIVRVVVRPADEASRIEGRATGLTFVPPVEESQ